MKILTLKDFNNDLGITNAFIRDTAKILQEINEIHFRPDSELNISDIHNPVITILEVNMAAEILHKNRINNGYPIVLKPAFYKKQTQKKCAVAPYIVLGNDELVSLKEKTKLDLKLVDLTYPVEHFCKLVNCNFIKEIYFIEDAKLLRISDAEISSSNTKEKTYYLKINWREEDLAKIKQKQAEGSLIEFFKAYPFAEQEYAAEVFDEKNSPIKILAINSQETKNTDWPIVADIDIHCFADQSPDQENTKSSHHVYDAADPSGRAELQDKINKLCASSSLPNFSVSASMGHITLKELFTFHKINEECNRNLHLINIETELMHLLTDILQHGSLENITELEKQAVPDARPDSTFPDIEKNTAVAVVFPESLDLILILTGLEILAFYDLLNEKFKYNFNLTVWKHQIKDNYETYQTIYKELEEQFEAIELSKKLTGIKTPLTSTAVKSTSAETTSRSNKTEQTLATSDIQLPASTTEFLTSHQQTLSFITDPSQQSNSSTQAEETKTTIKRKELDELQKTIPQETTPPANKRQNNLP